MPNSPVSSVQDTNLDLTVKLLARAYRMVGCNPLVQLQELGLTDTALPDRLPREIYVAAWADIARRSGREDIGLEVAEDLPLGSMGRLEWVCRSAATIGEALATLADCGRLLHTGGFYDCDDREDEVAFIYRPTTDEALPRPVIDWSMGYVLRIIRHEAHQRRLPGLFVTLQYPEPADTTRLAAFYDCPVTFEAECNAVVIAREVAELPMEQHDPATYRAIVDVLKQRLDTLLGTTMGEQVFASVLDELRRSGEPTLPRVARTMGVSERSLQRRLSEEGITFRALVEQVRAREASRMLRVPGATVTDVAFGLGYSSPSALYRSFRRHHGCSPTEYLRQV